MWPALVLVAAAACRPAPAPPSPLAGAAGWVPALPATHETLSAVLAGLPVADPSAAWPASTDAALRSYLGTVARRGPSSRPELFPAGEDAIAYLVDAHVAWTLALGHAVRLRDASVAHLREEPFTVDGAPASLSSLVREIAQRAPWEPRLALFLNPGWRGGPPLPVAALEGRALEWQLTTHAERCGRTSGFWTLDAAARRLSVPAYTGLMWGLPDAQPARTRRLIDLVPPPRPLREEILATCGASLQHCEIAAAPLDTGRLFAPSAPR